MKLLDDQSPMPIGKKYRGKPMIEVPDDYFKWLYRENKDKPSNQIDPITQSVLYYIEDHFDEREIAKW